MCSWGNHSRVVDRCRSINCSTVGSNSRNRSTWSISRAYRPVGRDASSGWVTLGTCRDAVTPTVLPMDRREDVARRVFAAWSSGDADAPAPLFTPDAVLNDVASGRFEGWPAIRDFFAAGLAKWDDLRLEPDAFWANDDGLALHYVMSATVRDPALYGADVVGQKWAVEVMSYLRFDGDRVCFEADFHDRGGRARALGLEPWIGAPPIQ